MAGKLVSLATVAVVAAGLYWAYDQFWSSNRALRELRDENARLAQQTRTLQQVVERLAQPRRMAEMLVTGQAVQDGRLVTNLLFVEYDRAGNPLPARSYTLLGAEVHIDALVIKFEHDLVVQNDPLRGHSILLFHRIYSEYQTPTEAHRLDEPGQIPLIYRSAEPAVSAFEQELWSDFWRLAEDPGYAAGKGVRVANGQGVFGPFKPGVLYTLSLEPGGGLNLTQQPMRGIYRELMQRLNLPALNLPELPPPSTGPGR